MQESNKVVCKICGKLKTRITGEKYPNSHNKRYTDEAGRLWNGKCCADCQANKTKENMKKLRFVRKVQSSEK
jgi:hypothetical protein